MASQVDCDNLYNKINIGGHSGLDLTFGNRAHYRAGYKIIEMNQNIVSYTGTARVRDSAVSSRTGKEAWYDWIGSYSVLSFKPAAYANLVWVPKYKSSTSEFLGVANPNINFTAFSVLNGFSGFTISYTASTGLYKADSRTWLNWSQYVNPFGMDISIKENGIANNAKVTNNTSPHWDFEFAYNAVSSDWETQTTWNHDVDFICKPSGSMDSEVALGDGSSGSIVGKLAFGTQQPTDSQRGRVYANGSGYKTAYDSNALYIESSMWTWGYIKHLPDYGSNTGKILSVGDNWEIGTNDKARYKSCAIEIDTSASNSAIKDVKLNSLEWVALKNVVPSCKNPEYGIPLFKCPGDGECELKIKLNGSSKVTMYTAQAANTTLSGGDSRLPTNTTYSANTEYTVKFNANKNDILFIYLVPSSTAWGTAVKITELSCTQNMEN